MNTRFLATLCAVAETGSIAGAARQLGLASATLHEQIRALEREIGAGLLTRRGRQVVLTEAGQAVLGPAREVLARLEDLRQVAQLGRPDGLLRLGAISTALVSTVPPALRLMAERYPRLEIKVTPGTSAQLFRLLEAGELDGMVASRPPFALPKSLLWLGVRAEPLVLAAPAELAGEEIGALLRAAPLIRMDRQSWAGRLVSRFLEENGHAPRELFEMDAPEAIIILVAQGLGVTLLHDWGFRPPAGQAIRRVPIPEERHARQIGLIVARRAREGLARLFAAALRESACS